MNKGYKPLNGFQWNPLLKYPRNQACYCHSGKKYKKCCLATELLVIPENEASKKISELVNIVRSKYGELQKSAD